MRENMLEIFNVYYYKNLYVKLIKYSLALIFWLFVCSMLLNKVASAAQSSYESWSIPENTAYASKVSPFGRSFVAPNGNLWFLTQASGNYRMLNYINASNGNISTPDYIKYSCCLLPSPQEDWQSYFVKDSTGKIFYTGADYRIIEIDIDLNGNPIGFGSQTYLPPAVGQGNYGGSNWGPEYFTIGPDDTFWYSSKVYTSGNVKIYNTYQDGTIINEYLVPVSSSGAGISGMTFGADGNIWLSTTISNTRKIVKLDINTGTLTNWTTNYGVNIKFVGADGNVWFVSGTAGSATPGIIGNITTSGVITYYENILVNDMIRGHGNKLLLTSSNLGTMQTFDVVDKTLTSYGLSSQKGYQQAVTSSNSIQYWYITYDYPKQNSYVGSYSYSVNRATLDILNASADIRSPKQNSYHTGNTVNISTQLSDTDGMNSVELYVNGVINQTITNPMPNQQIILDTSTLNDGQYSIYLRLYDSQGFIHDSSILNIALDRNVSNGFTPGIENFLIDQPFTNGSLTDLVEGSDKKLWGIYNGNVLFNFDPCTENFSKFTSPLRSGTSASYSTGSKMINASDGKIYYVDRNNTGISTISNNGSINQLVNIPTIRQDQPQYGFASITDLTEASNGNIWYAAYYDNLIGSIDKYGNLLSQVNLPDRPTDLATGSDGFIWVAYGTSANARLSRIDPVTLQMTTFTPPTPVPQFGDLILGKDGNMWFTSRYSTPEYIAKVTNEGTFTTFNLPTAKKPAKLAQDNNGKMWFTMNGSPDSYGVGYVDINSGTITDYIDNTYLTGIYNVIGASDGSIWYSKTSSGTAVGRFNFGAPVDCIKPTVNIASPTSNTLTKNTSIPVTVTSSDNNTVSSLEIFSNAISIKSYSNPAATENFTWNIASLADGKYDLTAKALDIRNNENISENILVTIDRTNPTGSFLTPSSSAILSNAASISVSASDTNGIASVAFIANGSTQTTDTTSPYTFDWNTTTLPNGSYIISALITDNAGNTTTISRTVTIQNTTVEGTTVVCHFPGTQGEFTLNVTNSSLRSHLGHGDYVGACRPSTTTGTSGFLKINDLEEFEEVDVLRQTNNTVIAYINEGDNLDEVNIELDTNETLVVNGSLGDVFVKSGATIKGNGKVKTISVQDGAFLSPGESPGCLTSDGLLLEGTYTFELGGVLACSEHDQVIVNGILELRGKLDIILAETYTPEIGQSYVIISNDDNDSVIGSFTGLAEGSTTQINGVTYKVSYAGGDGNDVELTVTDIDDEILTKQQIDATEVKDSSSLIAIIVIILVLLTLVAAKFVHKTE